MGKLALLQSPDFTDPVVDALYFPVFEYKKDLVEYLDLVDPFPFTDASFPQRWDDGSGEASCELSEKNIEAGINATENSKIKPSKVLMYEVLM